MASYIQHRLEVAGADHEIFGSDTFNDIFRYSGGVPRLVNTLCDTSMMAAFAANRDHVTREDLTNAIEELGWPEFSARTHYGLRGAADAPAPQHEPAAENAPRAVGRMLVATEGRTIQEIPLRVGRIIVGRTVDNDLQIDSRFVSRHHCQIITAANSCVIEDLNSTNGIYVKSKRVRRHYLNDGDVVVIGKHELIYVDERLPRIRNGFTETVPNVHPGAAPHPPVASPAEHDEAAD
jgi:general secretion pathway protein A